MIELGLPPAVAAPWFVTQPQQGFTRINVPANVAATWGFVLRDAFRRAYISDQRLQSSALAAQHTRAAVLAAKLPDAGAVMSGDFGEIVGYIYLASRDPHQPTIGPKRWRLKQDRTKAAPGSDVVQFILPAWPNAGEQDRVVCAEVKAKATPGQFRPIAKAIEGSQLDSTSRLARTLVWLRERALTDDIGTVSIAQLDRFINATEFPAYSREFHAIAVICTNLVEDEIATFVPAGIPDRCAVVIISVPQLRDTYTSVYEGVRASVAEAVPNAGGAL
jgi:hypothetical protein